MNREYMFSSESEVEIIYDGECPVCSAYFRLQRLRENGINARMIDAREHPEQLRKFASRGIDLNRDFVVRFQDQEYVGEEGMFVLSSLGTHNTMLRKINAVMFGSRTVSKVAYPFLRFGRRALLRLLGRSLIGANDAPST